MKFRQRQEEAGCTQEPEIGLVRMENLERARNGVLHREEIRLCWKRER